MIQWRADNSVIAARRLYDVLVARARSPVFPTEFLVSDTIDGRFDLLSLHASPVLEALKSQGAAGARLGSHLVSAIFAGFDDALRELGVGDFGISPRIKAIANAFYGRLEGYGAARSEEALTQALLRNLYRSDAARKGEAGTLAHYIASARRNLASGAPALVEGSIDFGPLPQL